ncbi:MAG: DNA polymerase IV [Chloroflexi bacterium]|nr:DNA polymerase IV [Chloroflexota bacterium]
MERRIIHIDLDAFFCSVEELLDPAIRGKPIIVGADPKGRGVVAAASYAARRYGVHSAMPIGHAARLCPNAVFLRPRHDLYAEYSHRLMAVLREYTDLVEPISIDEAFLDVTGCQRLFGRAEDIGRAIQRRVQEEIGLPCSVGIATNKLVAKIASDSGKPNGFVVVPPRREAEFLASLPVSRLWGVGPKTAERLRANGVQTIGDLAALPADTLRARFGRLGEYLHQRALGQDTRPVEPERERKSISNEHTFFQDSGDPDVITGRLLQSSERVAAELRRKGWQARTIALKIRFADFKTITRRRTLGQPTSSGETIWATAKSLLRDALKPGAKLRLVGVGASNLIAAVDVQPSFFDGEAERIQELDRTLDHLRDRFGKNSILRGRVAGKPAAPGGEKGSQDRQSEQQ